MRPAVVGTLLSLALAAQAVTAQANPAQGPVTNLPVKSVVLFSSGVGYFEHAGTVRGDGAAELRFKTAQINDVLKSLTLQDLDGGRVSAISYPSQDPISKTLRSFQVDITSNPSMMTLLNQLRGARISVVSGTDHLSGTILGVETRLRPTEKGEAMQTPTLNLMSGATIRAIDLQAISSLTLDDPVLQDELTKALSALGQSRDQDKKPVTVNFAGSGDRRVRMGYVVETPIWKTSYRLLLDDKTAHIQGWAIVENQTESDWNNISLSLVSGRPISFIMDLYQPLYMERPVVVPELFSGLRPQRYDEQATYLNGTPVGSGGGRGGAVPRDQVTTRQTIGGQLVDRLPVDRLNPAIANQAGRATNAFEDASITTGASSSEFGNAQAGVINIASVRSVASAARLGELFQYAINNVTIARQKSAMLPIITDSIRAERLSIYNAAVLPRNPLNGVRLRNNTGKHLLQGPVTVLDKNSYAGDAQLDNLPPGQDRLLSYGVDLDVVVDNSRRRQDASVVTAKIVKGLLLIDRRVESSQGYQVDNKSGHEKTILIEHPIQQGFRLVDSLAPVERTSTAYRYQLVVAAGKSGQLTVKEQSMRQQTMALLSASSPDLLVYSRTGEIPVAVRNALAKAMQMKQDVDDTDAQVTDRTTRLAAISAEQDRIRENMKTVEPKSQYYERLLAKLNDQESAIERLQRERDELYQRHDNQRKALEDFLAGLTVG